MYQYNRINKGIIRGNLNVYVGKNPDNTHMRDRKDISDIKKGDMVYTDKNISMVACVIKILIPSTSITITNVNNMLILPNHPIRVHQNYDRP